MTKVNLSKYNNSWYDHGPMIRRLLWLFFGRVFVNTYFPWPSSVRVSILRLFGAKIGKQSMFKPKVSIKYPWHLEVGNYVWIGENVCIDNLDLVRIGSNSCISQDVLLLTGNHDYKKVAFDLIVGKIILEEGVWLGAQTLITQNVTCKRQSVLAAGSVLNRSMEENEIWRGNPAQFVRKRDLL